MFSANKRFRVEVTHGKHAAFSARGALGLYFHKATFPFPPIPYWALVSDDGNYFVTVDEAGALGHGDHTVAIFRPTGALIRKFSLTELLTLDDIDTFTKSVSSIWWGGLHHLNREGQLVLRIVSNGKLPGEPAATFHELRIELESGKPVEPKRDLFTAMHKKHSIRLAAAKLPLPESFAEHRCVTNAVANFNQPHVSLERLPQPNSIPYPRLAIMARIQGTVIADAQVNTQGAVDCVRIRRGHPLLLEATYDVLLNAKADSGGAAHAAVAVVFELGN